MVTAHLAAALLAVSGVNDVVLLDFGASWCGPCQQMEPTIDRLVAAGYPIQKVDVDRRPDLKAKYRVDPIPCFVLVVNGREVNRIVGATSATELVRMFEAAKPTPRAALRTRGQSPDVTLAPAPRTSAGAAGSRIPPRGTSAAVRPIVPERSRDPLSAAPAGASSVAADELVRSNVRLIIEDPDGRSYGSGTIIDSRDGEALVLTCGHIFRDSKGKGSIAVDLFGTGAPKGLAGRLVKYDLKRDVGLVSIRTEFPVRVAPLAPERHRLAVGQRVVNIGCDHGAEPTVLSSNVLAIDKFVGPPNVQVSGEPVQGRSGGGLFTADGMVVGVCNAADPQDRAGLYAASPTIHAVLRDAGISELLRPADATPAPPSVAIRDFTEREPRRLEASNTLLARPSGIADERPVASREPASNGVETADLVDVKPGRDTLSDSEQALLSAIRSKSRSAEVICIIRRHGEPDSKSEILVLNQASPAFLATLEDEQGMARQRSVRATGHSVPRVSATARRVPASSVYEKAAPQRGK